MQKDIYFGLTMIELLDKFGNPNKEYHQGEHLVLNFFELGMDVIID